MDRHLIIWAITVILVLIVGTSMCYYMGRSYYAPVSASSSTGMPDSGWTVYGTKGCGWTRKQLSHMDEKNVPYTFVDCDSEDCPGISAFPTLKGSDGTVKTGYTPM